MTRQTMLQVKKESQPLQTGSLFRRQAAQVPVEEHDIAPLPVGFGRDYSQIPFRPPQPPPPMASVSCPFSPQRCPFGGACHACPPKMQAKLKIGQPGDRYEQEADRVAETVMRMPEPQVQRKGCSAPGCKDEDDEKKLLQTKPANAGKAGAQVDHPLIQSVLSSPGQPLDAGTRSFMEPRFGQDFSGVRVHLGGEAAEAARAVNARAYTVGRDVVFGEGQYAPGSDEGKRLVAHELVHVGQQIQPDNAGLIATQVREKCNPVKFNPLKTEAYYLQRFPANEDEARRRIAEIESIISNSSQSPEGLREFEMERNRLADFLRAPMSISPIVYNRPNRGRPPVSTSQPSPAEEAAQRSDPILHDFHDQSTTQDNSTSSSESTVPRPSGLPLAQGYTLYQVTDAPLDFVRSIPENSLTTVDMGALPENQSRASSGEVLGGIGTSSAGVGNSLLVNSSRALTRGFVPIPSGNAIGLVGYSSAANLSILEVLSSIGPRNGIPAGHTALVMMRNGRLSVVGFGPASSIQALANYRGLFSTGRGAPPPVSVPASITNNIGIFRNPTAQQIMWDLSPEAIARINSSANPEQVLDDVLREIPTDRAGASGAPPTEYTGRPGELGNPNATNCVGFACREIAGRTGEPVRARMRSGAVEPIVQAGGGRQLQGRMMQAMAPEAAEAIAGSAPRAAGMSRTLRFMRVGGRLFLVIGVVLSGIEIARATYRRDYRSATQEVGGFAAGAAAGAAAGLLCGPGAPLCSIGFGLVFGIGGYFAGRAVSGAAYDAATGN